MSCYKKDTINEDVIVNYIVEGKQGVYLAQDPNDRVHSERVTIGIKPTVGLTVYPPGATDVPTLKQANALKVLKRTKNYTIPKSFTEDNTADFEKKLHKKLCTVFTHWNPDDYLPDQDNPVFFDGYRLTMK